MALPKVKVPVYTLVLPSTKQKIDYRTFTVKEEKLLLMAKEDESPTGFISAITQVINNCVVTPNIDVSKFAIFDIEYFFLKLRSKSVGNIVQVNITDKDDNNVYPLEIDLDKIDVTYNPKHTAKIVLDEASGIGVVMKYPTLEAATSIDVNGDPTKMNAEAVFGLIKQCLDSIFDKSNVYKAIDSSDTELQEWFDDLSADHLAKIQGFFDTFPTLKYSLTYKRKDGSDGSVVLEGIRDFFQ